MPDAKITRGILASTNIDSHEDQMTIEALKKMVEYINNPTTKIRFGIDHRPDFPPKGICNNAALVKKGNLYVVEADFCEFEESQIASWDETLVVESFSIPFTFIEVKSTPITTISVSTDPHNFSTTDEYNNYLGKISRCMGMEVKMHESLRRSELPIPEITFTLTSSVLVYQLLKPTFKKVGDKIADKISDKVIEEGEKAFIIIETALKEAFYRLIPKSRPVTTIFDYPGKPHIQLIAKTRDAGLLLKALTRISNVLKEIENHKKHVNIAKVQYILDDKGKWKFNYLLTTDGKSIGKKKAIAKRERRNEIILSDANNAGRSVGVSAGISVKGAKAGRRILK